LKYETRKREINCSINNGNDPASPDMRDGFGEKGSVEKVLDQNLSLEI
jgi:hypothetical protein